MKASMSSIVFIALFNIKNANFYVVNLNWSKQKWLKTRDLGAIQIIHDRGGGVFNKSVT
jgi:hypothetical protein